MMPRYFLRRLSIEGFRGVNNENDPLDISFRPDAVNSAAPRAGEAHDEGSRVTRAVGQPRHLPAARRDRARRGHDTDSLLALPDALLAAAPRGLTVVRDGG